MFPLEEEIQLGINSQCPRSGRESSAQTASIYWSTHLHQIAKFSLPVVEIINKSQQYKEARDLGWGLLEQRRGMKTVEYVLYFFAQLRKKK